MSDGGFRGALNRHPLIVTVIVLAAIGGGGYYYWQWQKGQSDIDAAARNIVESKGRGAGDSSASANPTNAQPPATQPAK